MKINNFFTELGDEESRHISGGSCGCNDSFFSRLGSRIGNFLMKRAEEVNSWSSDDPRFNYR